MAAEVIPAPVHGGRRLDWFPRFDPASLDYPMAAGPSTPLPTRGRLWTHGPILDQGSEGACVGAGCVAEAAAEPVPVPRMSMATARAWYRRAQRRDVWPGESYDGTSVLAGCLEGRARGLYSGFRWAKRAEQLAAGIVEDGPAIIGVEWREGSYSTDELGVLRPSGNVVGGHCVCVVGYVPADVDTDPVVQDLEELDLWDGVRALIDDDGEDGAFIVQNSWGPSFGKGGLCVVPLSVMRDWVRSGGEFAQPQGRRLPATKTATAPDQDENGREESTTTEHINAGDVTERDRIMEGHPARDLGKGSVTVTQVRRARSGMEPLVRVTTRHGAFTLPASSPVTVRRPE